MKRTMIGPMGILVTGLFAAPAHAGNAFENHEHYRAALETLHLRGDAAKARKQFSQLSDQLPAGDPLADQLDPTPDDSPNPAPDQAELAYATGSKKEFYCKGTGLVMAEGSHNDGSWSKLLLVSSDREIQSDDYAIVRGGQWSYELSTSFRSPVLSEVWQTFGSETSFNIFEVRRLEGGGTDHGVWDHDYNQGRFSMRHSVNSRTVEPLRSLQMATQYHMWGSPNLGYQLKFETGFRDRRRWRANGEKSGRFFITSQREVAEHLPEVSFTDGKGSSHTFKDCYRVNLLLTFDPAENTGSK